MAAEALILSMIQKLERRQARFSCFRFCMVIRCIFDSDRDEEMENFIMEEKKVIDELRTVVDILRHKKLEDAKRVDYFISDLVEMAQDALDLYQNEKSDTFSYEIKSIQSSISEIKMRLLKFEGYGAEPESDMRSINVGEGDDEGEDVVGLEEDVQLLLCEMIFNETRLMSSSSTAPIQDKKHGPWTSLITGVAGIGKTTLARQVFKHRDVVDRFERRAWVCSSTELTNKEVLMKLLQQVIDSEELKRGSLLEKIEQADNRTLQRMLQQHLQGMRYLIVIDHLPKQRDLKSILRGLPHEDKGSKLLLTSRSKETERLTHYTLEMEPLDSEQSWQLFKAIFSGNNSTNEPEIPKKLVKRLRDMLLTQCRGVPLAITEVARQLSGKRRAGSEWEQLLQPIDFHEILEVIVLPIIQSLESSKKRKLKRIAHNLGMVLDFVRDHKLGEGTRLYHFICDLVDMAQDLHKNWCRSHIVLEPFQSWATVIQQCISSYGVDGVEMRLENVEIEGDDENEDVVAIGLEKDMQRLFPCFGEQRTSVLQTFVITGVVGIGKTTLARQVYNHAEVVNQFDCRAWVCIRTDFSHRKVLMKIMRQVVHCEELERDSLLEKMDRLENHCLRKMLHKHLQGMRYFIVLDGFPKEMCLDYILGALPSKDKGSKLLLTSRSKETERLTHYTLEMEPLDSEQSWQLFEAIFSGNNSTNEPEIPKQLVKRLRDMLLTQCRGVPLAITEVARQLSGKRRAGSEWEQLLQPIDFHEILEVIVLPIIQNLESSQKQELKQIANDLGMVLDFVRDYKLGEGTRLYHFICDLVDMAQDLHKNWCGSHIVLEPFQSWTTVIQQCISSYGVDGVEMRLENVEIEGDDENEDVVAIGLEKDMQRLFPCFGEQRTSVLQTFVITGVVGIGKTTLARQVYNHAEVVNQFDCRAWVCIRTDFSHRKVLMKIMRQVVHCEELERDSLLEKMDRLENHCLRKMLHEHLQGMRYFIVLDGFPKEMCLDYILGALPSEDKGSKILLTSRTKDARINCFTHEMEPLDSDKSWQLFMINQQEFPKQLVKRVRDMLLTSRCGGVPSAIKEVARQLAEKRRSGSEWEQLLPPIGFHAILEVILLPIIQKLDSRGEQELEWITGDLRMVLDFVRDKELGEGSGRLYHFICDLVDMAQDVDKKWSNSGRDVEPFQSWTKVIKTRMLKFGADGAKMRSENIETEGVDKDGDVAAIGLEDDVEVLLRRVISREQGGSRLSTCLITGMVGIGKTTLARQVYNHVDVINQFDVCAWVCVSTNFSHKKILMNIIKQVVNCEEFKRDSLLENMDRPENLYLRQMLQNHLQGKRFFIVLDDFPKGLYLEYILEALPFEDRGSRVLLTSRTARIEYTSSTNYIDYIHWVETLDTHNSWKLLLKTIPSELNFPKNLEKIAKEMLRRCDGVPLAIIEVGKQMAKGRLSKRKWDKVIESIDFGAVLVLFESIYDELDSDAKPCFWHLALLKEHTFRAEKLRHILVTTGTVSKHKIESYLGILNEECVIQIKDKRRYRINAIIHELSIRKAEEKIGLEILRNGGNNRPSQSTRHRVVICSREKFSYSTNQDEEHLVSLFFRGGGYFDTSPSYWESKLRLKILDFDDFGLTSLPESIGHLSELRYLGLRNNYIKELPSTLGRLTRLEVLDIAINLIAEVPDVLQKIRSLRHLYMSDIIGRMSTMIDILENIETLTFVSIDDYSEITRRSKKFDRLGKVGIEELEKHSRTTLLYKFLADSPALDYLILRSRFRSMPSEASQHVPSITSLGHLLNLKRVKLEGCFEGLSESFQLPQNIEYLKLANCCLDVDPMRLFPPLHKLKHLKLRNAYTGQQMKMIEYKIPNLEILCIEELWNLTNLQVSKSAMSNLKVLEIKNCPNLENLPEAIWSMNKLEKLKIVTTKRIATKIRETALKSKIGIIEISPQ